jgi:hypothetical protein
MLVMAKMVSRPGSCSLVGRAGEKLTDMTGLKPKLFRTCQQANRTAKQALNALRLTLLG